MILKIISKKVLRNNKTHDILLHVLNEDKRLKQTKKQFQKSC